MSSAGRNIATTYPARVLLAAAVVAVLSLWAALDYYRGVDDLVTAGADTYAIGAQQERFRQATTLLPGDALVGYLSDVPFDGNVRGGAAFFAAQYALAPRILIRFPHETRRPDWVLGNFSRPADYQSLAQGHGLAVVKDFGNGLVVFRRRAG